MEGYTNSETTASVPNQAVGHNGYIGLYRTLMHHPIWTCERFTRGQAWVDLLMLANYKDGYIRVRGVKISVKRGQVGWSVLSLASRWGWSRGKVDRYLNELEAEQQIVQQKNRLSGLITITNYREYQECRTTKDTTDGQQTDTNNNDNKKGSKNICAEQELFDLWNATVKGKLSAATKLSTARKKKCAARLKERPLEEWRFVFEKMAASNFCRSGPWCSFDWIIKNDNNAVKVLEGQYANKDDKRKDQGSTEVAL